MRTEKGTLRDAFGARRTVVAARLTQRPAAERRAVT
jgi:hypothetical protein